MTNALNGQRKHSELYRVLLSDQWKGFLGYQEILGIKSVDDAIKQWMAAGDPPKGPVIDEEGFELVVSKKQKNREAKHQRRLEAADDSDGEVGSEVLDSMEARARRELRAFQGGIQDDANEEEDEFEGPEVDTEKLEQMRLDDDDDDPNANPQALFLANDEDEGVALFSPTQVKEFADFPDVWDIPPPTRRQVVKIWFNRISATIKAQLEEKLRKYNVAVQEKLEFDSETDLGLLRRAAVIGMTTTAVARYSRLLANLKPKVVFVEEAAEVLESHILASLSESTEHLILIGV